MNTYKILLFWFLFSSVNAFSQQNYHNDGRYGGGGVDREIGRDYSHQASKPTPEEIEKSRTVGIEKLVMKLKTDLSLDELQVIVIRNELTSNSKNVDIVLKKDNSDEEKSKDVKALMDKLEISIKSYLNKDQKEKYDAAVEAMKGKKKDKKNKKNTKTEE